MNEITKMFHFEDTNRVLIIAISNNINKYLNINTHSTKTQTNSGASSFYFEDMLVKIQGKNKIK